MLCASEFGHTLDGQQIRADATNLGTHAVEHVTQLLDIGFAGSVIDSGHALCHHGSHNNIGSTRHRGLIQQHISTFQTVARRQQTIGIGRNLIDIARLNLTEFGSQFLESEEVGVQASATNLVATGFGDNCLAHTCQQRTNHHDGATQLCTFVHKLVALQEVQVQLISLEGVSAGRSVCHLYANLLQELDEIIDVTDIGDIADGDGFAG